MKSIFSILVIMVPTITFGILDMPTQMTISLFAGFVCAVIINIDKFDSFKAWQIEAKMKKAEKIIDEANATIEQLRSITEPLLNSNLILLIYDGVFDGMDATDKEKTLDELMKIREIIDVDSEYTNGVLERAKNSIANFFFSEISWVLDKENKTKFDAYFDTMKAIDQKPYSIQELDNFFADNSELLTDEVITNIKSYKRFIVKYY